MLEEVQKGRGMTDLDMVQVPRAVSSYVDGVRVCSRRAAYVLVRVDCCRHSTVIKSTILPSTSAAWRGEIAKGKIQHN
jgi:hypothetical protein